MDQCCLSVNNRSVNRSTSIINYCLYKNILLYVARVVLEVSAKSYNVYGQNVNVPV